ncbi:uncharacterized protein FMAN_03149 [Fusarium mangiferae]|uniref:Uncharacterized protein n=1 Tax=Fusarium mangiferae TaxID=192010 RepID=A0A1L7T782_FUSMA|nr:uncharacterized protein FMAN_03149 [Fusarium mangiferae]CVK93789.1 uncharacterized protein FMAN_03149 [Fusarium mangiferae]
MDEPSLHALLSRENPIFKVAHGASNYHATKGVSIESITRWVDFNLQNIISAYGHILSRHASSLQKVNLENAQAEEQVRNVTELKKAVYHWLDSICVPLDAPLIPKKGSQPNWSFFTGQDHRIYLVTGTFRLSKAWSSEKLEQQTSRCNEPIEQLARHAVEAETRYGFILSEREVVVVCFYNTKQGKLAAKWQPVPRSACSQDMLTANLAIWTLTMMGLNDQHRSVLQEAYTMPLNAWLAQPGHYRNHLSGRVLSNLPTGGIIREQ